MALSVEMWFRVGKSHLRLLDCFFHGVLIQLAQLGPHTNADVGAICSG